MSLGFTSLKKRKDFLRLRNNCSSLDTKNFIFNYKKDQSVSEPIVGITISNKVGNSVKRNYIKRLIRSIISRIYTIYNMYKTYNIYNIYNISYIICIIYIMYNMYNI